MDAEILRQIESAAAFAAAGPFPGHAEALEDMYAA